MAKEVDELYHDLIASFMVVILLIGFVIGIVLHINNDATERKREMELLIIRKPDCRYE